MCSSSLRARTAARRKSARRYTLGEAITSERAAQQALAGLQEVPQGYRAGDVYPLRDERASISRKLANPPAFVADAMRRLQEDHQARAEGYTISKRPDWVPCLRSAARGAAPARNDVRGACVMLPIRCTDDRLFEPIGSALLCAGCAGSRPADAHVHPCRAGSRRAAGAARGAGNAAACLAAAGPAHRGQGVGQAREPHADRRLQGARRRHLHRRPDEARAQGEGRRHGHARQPRPVGGPLRHKRRPRLRAVRAARQLAREERGHAGLRRRARRGRRRLRRGQRACRALRQGEGLPLSARLPCRPRQGRGDLCAGAVPGRAPTSMRSTRRSAWARASAA